MLSQFVQCIGSPQDVLQVCHWLGVLTRHELYSTTVICYNERMQRKMIKGKDTKDEVEEIRCKLPRVLSLWKHTIY